MCKRIGMRLIVLLVTFMLFLTTIPVTVFADNTWDYDGGALIAWTDLDVYSDNTWSERIGKIFVNEGFTILHLQSPEYESNPWIEVEYSTSNGAKQGYVHAPYVGFKKSNRQCMARVVTYSTVYAGPNSATYSTIGSVSANEKVAILAKNDDWAYVEYNTTSGRKRGFMSFSNLFCYLRPFTFNDLPTYSGMEREAYVEGFKTVYSGPTSKYASIGSVKDEVVTYFYHKEYDVWGTEYNAIYIEYEVEGSGKKKQGFILY